MKVDILRFPSPLLTLGVLCIERMPFCVTLELPWKDNEPNVSCIPTGTYLCKLRKASPGITAGLNKAYEIMDVPSRGNILFHVANVTEELRGCIALGSSYKEHAILASREAFTRFMRRMEGGDFSLTIQEVLL